MGVVLPERLAGARWILHHRGARTVYWEGSMTDETWIWAEDMGEEWRTIGTYDALRNVLVSSARPEALPSNSASTVAKLRESFHERAKTIAQPRRSGTPT